MSLAMTFSRFPNISVSERKTKMKKIISAILVLSLLSVMLVSCNSSGSDITLSDLWTVPDLVPQLNDDKGASGVSVNTEKGAAAFAKLLPEFVQEVDKTKARSCNSGFSASIEVPAAREVFFKGAHLTPDIVAHMKKYVVAEPVTRRLWRTVRSMLSKFKRRMFV